MYDDVAMHVKYIWNYDVGIGEWSERVHTYCTILYTCMQDKVERDKNGWMIG